LTGKAADLKKRARELRRQRSGEKKERREGRPVTLKLVDEAAPPILNDDGSWTGRVASWFVEEGVGQGLELGEMEGEILRDTEEAVLCRRTGDSREVWIPRSVAQEVEA